MNFKFKNCFFVILFAGLQVWAVDEEEQSIPLLQNDANVWNEGIENEEIFALPEGDDVGEFFNLDDLDNDNEGMERFTRLVNHANLLGFEERINQMNQELNPPPLRVPGGIWEHIHRYDGHGV